MPVVAVINRKGGSGKSTLATHLAGYCARQDRRVMLGDVDRQQSSLSWLRRRGAQAAAEGASIVGWAVDTRSVMRPPAGVTHVVLDTPGGLRGFDLARVVMSADAILMPVCDSAFDRDSAAACHAELMTLPKVATGRCKVAMVGMRVDARTKGAARLEAWAAGQGVPWLGSVRESQLYVRSAEQGLTLFDLPAAKVEGDLAQWRAIVEWIEETWKATETPPARVAPEAPRARAAVGPPASAAAAAATQAVAASSAQAAAPARASAPLPVPLVDVRSSRERERSGPARWLFNVFRSSST
jgi:chromosome partitioning protein